jgi:hypothetical protein
VHADTSEAGAGPAEAVGEVDGHGVVVAVEVRGVLWGRLGGGNSGNVEVTKDRARTVWLVVSFREKEAQGTAGFLRR